MQIEVTNAHKEAGTYTGSAKFSIGAISGYTIIQNIPELIGESWPEKPEYIALYIGNITVLLTYWIENKEERIMASHTKDGFRSLIQMLCGDDISLLDFIARIEGAIMVAANEASTMKGILQTAAK